MTNKPFFATVNNHADFPALEKEVLSFWKRNDTFKKSLAQTRDKNPFVFFDGPPFATGLPHYGHLVGGTIKDIVPRYRTMRGRHVERRFGWDCHGLPIESLVQKELGLASVKEIREFGVGRFNETCRANVLKYVAEWRATVERMGRWVDFDNDYKTMDCAFMESVWWVFRQCFDKGLIYQDYRVQPYSPALATPLSNFEVNQGYQDRQDPAVTLTFPLARRDGSLLVWTTTPWTLPSNLAIAVNPDLVYVKVAHEGRNHWIAQSRLAAYFPAETPVLEQATGAQLAGTRYEPLFTFVPKQSERQYTVITGDFVTDADGTGAVHIAPSFGEDDFVAGRAAGLGLFDPLDAEGKFTSLVPDWQGIDAKEADKQIIRALKERGRVLRHETIVHSYPHCWRTGVPLLYRALKTWFLAVDREIPDAQGVTKPLKQWMIESNRQIRWVPEHLRDGRFGKWLDGARDWNLGRNRFWGTPIPVWVNENDEHDVICVGSVAQLEALTGQKVTDLHMHMIDTLELRTSDRATYDPKGARYVRTHEVLDCWFESGSMPYAQNHFPFENKAKVEAGFPADFIAEGIDQTRGWFYTLTVLSAALFQKPAFKNVIVNGIVLAENGQKMSKSLRNYTPPDDMMERLGADAMRLFLINSPAVRAEDLKFSDAGVLEMTRAVLLPFWNAYSFFVTYANVDGWRPHGEVVRRSDNELDRWIISLLNHVVAMVNTEMEACNLYKVVPHLVDFIDNLTNWYIRRSRRRFWRSENDGDKLDAYATLHRVLTVFSRVMAPFLPFVSEAIWRNLSHGGTTDDSVHLQEFPQAQEELINRDLEDKMATARRAVGMGHALRSKHTLKNRLPLPRLTIVLANEHSRALISSMERMIADELNVKEVVFSADEEALVTLAAKPNYKKLGSRLGPRMKDAAKVIEGFTPAQINELRNGGTVTVLDVAVTLADLDIRLQKKADLELETDGNLTVALDTRVTPELIAEGMAREFVNRIQNIRKQSGFDVTDRITVTVCTDGDLARALETFSRYICDEILAVALDVSQTPHSGGGVQEVEVNDLRATVVVARA